jgi:hypothetical protein
MASAIFFIRPPGQNNSNFNHSFNWRTGYHEAFARQIAAWQRKSPPWRQAVSGAISGEAEVDAGKRQRPSCKLRQLRAADRISWPG